MLLDFWLNVTYGGSTFVAIASGTNVSATSPDGITWTARTMPVSGAWTGIAYGSGIFYAVTYDNTSIAASSPDGITWTSRTMTSTFSTDVAFGNGKFVAVAGGTATTAAASSP